MHCRRCRGRARCVVLRLLSEEAGLIFAHSIVLSLICLFGCYCFVGVFVAGDVIVYDKICGFSSSVGDNMLLFFGCFCCSHCCC